MQKLLLFITLLFSCSASKPPITSTLTPQIAVSKISLHTENKAQPIADITINDDTTINTNTNFNGVILHCGSGAHIHTTTHAVLSNFILDCDSYQPVFDTTLTLSNFHCYNHDFSVCNFGASPSLTDNSYVINYSINTCINNNLPRLKVPWQLSAYNTLHPIIESKLYKGSYVGVTLDIYGESYSWGANATIGSIIQYNGVDSFAFGIQEGKNCIIEGLIINGKDILPAPASFPTLTKYYTCPLDSFTDRNFLCSSNYSGIVFDPFTNGGSNGSTHCALRNLQISNFQNGIWMPGYVNNGEEMVFQDIHFGNNATLLNSNGAEQEDDVVDGFYCWGYVNTAFVFGINGSYGQWKIENVDLAQNPINFVYAYIGAYNSISFVNDYAESLGSIGTVNGSPSMYPSHSSMSTPCVFRDCTFKFELPSLITKMNVLSCSQPDGVTFSGGSLRDYGEPDSTLMFGGYCPSFVDSCTHNPITGCQARPQ